MATQQRYQVFVSSTFLDLQDERREVQQAILEMDCFPAGMELFPASDEHAWRLIQGVIDASDYYVLVIGGRYGSVDGSGLSFTEKEYRYARERGIPVLAFVHGSPEELPFARSEPSPELRERLSAFRCQLDLSHHVRRWRTPADLGRQVAAALRHAFKTSPRRGWVRSADSSRDPEASSLDSLTGVDHISSDELDKLTPPIPQRTDLGYEIQYRTPWVELSSAARDQPSEFATHIAGLISFTTHGVRGPVGIAGYVEATRLRIGDGRSARHSMYDLFDSVDAELEEAYTKLFDENGRLLESIDVMGRPEDHWDILIVRRLEILPLHRRKGLGLFATRHLIETFGEGCGLIVGLVWPLGLDEEARGPWFRSLDLVGFSYRDDKAVQRLVGYFSRLGFNPVPDSDLIYLDGATYMKDVEGIAV